MAKRTRLNDPTVSQTAVYETLGRWRGVQGNVASETRVRNQRLRRGSVRGF